MEEEGGGAMSGKGSSEDRKNAVTEPGVGVPSRQPDTVDLLLEGFGSGRADLPPVRGRSRKEDTPAPAPGSARSGRKELTPTEPSARQRRRAIILALVVSFVLVAALGIVLVKLAAAK
jgi:hypothetical protein